MAGDEISKRIGRLGEDFAARWLEYRGCEILERNFRTKYGEVDIIARSEKHLMFIEVKTRSNDKFGQPREAVTYYKQKRIVYAAEEYIKANSYDRNLRFDVIEVYFASRYDSRPEKMTHIKSAFSVTDDGHLFTW